MLTSAESRVENIEAKTTTNVAMQASNMEEKKAQSNKMKQDTSREEQVLKRQMKHRM